MKDFNGLIDGKNVLKLLLKIKKKHTEKLLKWKEIMTTQQVISWIMNIFQSIRN